MSISLIGSRTEQGYRSELLASRESCFGEESGSPLKQVLIGKGYDVTRAIVIGWTPDQGEDIYTVLVLPDIIISVEIDRKEQVLVPPVEIQAIEDYRKSLSKTGRIKLAVAFDILNKG